MKAKLFIILSLVFFPIIIFSQTFTAPVDYMDYMTKEYSKITKETWDYTSAVAHGKSARKVEKRRKEVLKTISKASKIISKVEAYNGEVALKDTIIAFLDLYYNVVNNDYAKIVDMEAVAEQSYDAMEAYLLAQDLANDKLDQANDRVDLVQNEFARNHNITITENKSELSKKIEQANLVFDYYREIYLIFFKSYKQEAYMLEAISRGDVNAIEQNRNALISTSTEGLDKLKEIKSFKSNQSLKSSCTKMLVFLKDEAENEIGTITDFYLTNENFDKVKAAFEAKKESKRTQKDVDEFNKAVKEVNKASNNFNAKNQELFNKRSMLLNQWNDNAARFLDQYVSDK